MTEVTLAKRIIALASALLVVMGAAACTREKPPVTEPTPTGVVALEVATPTIVLGSGAASPTTTAPLALPTVPGAETPNLPPALPTLPLTTTQPVVLPTTETSITTTSPALPPASSGTPSGGNTSGGTTSSPSTYTIQWGDWLNKIATRFGVTTQAILVANPGLDPNKIYPGQVINIPAGSTAVTSSTPGPNAVITPASTGTGTGNAPGTYTVQRGDWFYAIARKFGVSVSALQAANPTINANAVYPGQVLNIPGGSTGGSTGGTTGGEQPVAPSGGSSGSSYVVRQGDTLYAIAIRFGKTVYALQIANHLPNSNFIYPGQTLVIP
jgi:LysM repeat protein